MLECIAYALKDSCCASSKKNIQASNSSPGLIGECEGKSYNLILIAGCYFLSSTSCQCCSLPTRTLLTFTIAGLHQSSFCLF